jgi:hypothetical protein
LRLPNNRKKNKSTQQARKKNKWKEKQLKGHPKKKKKKKKGSRGRYTRRNTKNTLQTLGGCKLNLYQDKPLPV